MGQSVETSANNVFTLDSGGVFDDLTPRPLLSQALSALAHDRAAMIGIFLFLILVAAAVFASLISPYDPLAIHPQERLQLPTLAHLLGTDELGRDILSRVIYGSRVSIAVGIISVGIAGLVGVPLGLIGGYRGGLTDAVIMRVMDALLAFPGIILALAIVTVLGPGFVNAMIAIGIVAIPGFARIVRASALSVKEHEFVVAARALGASDLYIMARVILPNCLSPLLVKISVSYAAAILTETTLAFLGLGVPPPTPSWGAMLDAGRKYLTETPWYSVSAGAAIFLAVLSLNLLGDGLRDVFDPRLRGH